MHSWWWVYKMEKGSTIKGIEYLYFKIASYYSKSPELSDSRKWKIRIFLFLEFFLIDSQKASYKKNAGKLRTNFRGLLLCHY